MTKTKTYYLLNDRGEKILLRREMAENTMDHVLKAQKILSEIITPWITQYSISLFNKEFHYPLSIEDENTRDWLFIKNNDFLNPKPIIELFGHPKIEYSNLEILTDDWSSQINNIIPKEENAYYGIISGKLFSGAARIENTEDIDNLTLVDRNLKSIVLPLIYENNSSWVHGPDNILMTYPPVFYEVYVDQGYTYFSIWITWKDLWETYENGKNKLFEDVINKIINEGWNLQK